MRKTLLLALLLLTACAPVVTPLPTPAEPALDYKGLNTQALVAYHATFLLRFEGDSSWSYRLDARSDGTAHEYLLELEGLSPAQDPGDVRLVSQGGVSRMRGEGTDGQCVQFPSDMALGPSFLLPDDLLAPAELTPFLQEQGQQQVNGVDATLYSLSQASLAGWGDVGVDLWLDPVTGAVLRYDLQASGADPLFDSGSGALTGRYLVNQIGGQAIAPITGCEIDLPLPEEHHGLLKLPGLVAFESTASLPETVDFYRARLPDEGWTESDEPLVGQQATVLSYERDGEALEINIEQSDPGVTVELLMGP
jgi:hypothetical protein